MTNTFGDCAICGQGQLIAVKGVASRQLFVICDDCGSQWKSPLEAQRYQNALLVEVDERVVDASDEEVAAIGWEKHVM
jgi:hypothetical protein